MKLQLREMIMIGIFAALMVVGAKLSIPTPFGVPLTFQLFFSIYAGLLLGAKAGFLSQLIYILLGLVGLPVFTMGGGIAYIFNPTFGYIIGFAVAPLIVGILLNNKKDINFVKVLGISIVGFAAIYIIGNVYLYFIKDLYLNKPTSLVGIFKSMIPFMIKDFILVIIAAYSSTIIIPVLRKSGVMN
ncbi:biotin transporter BioY [Vallitalea sp.]|jgi:biotin transport system substrate-specific component|uniref:biotin transporter BioY n=1 Tax=Vallitalea sp. TaxID=1882829 RepID=UPI0025D65CA2|nr:biotin transporter BioY [Vallitalea sp.]MCT4686543.1 biotin transporter BioY [Vallitalea sp.]